MVTSSTGTMSVIRKWNEDCLLVRNMLSYVVMDRVNSSTVLMTKHGSDWGAASATHELSAAEHMTVVFSVVK